MSDLRSTVIVAGPADLEWRFEADGPYYGWLRVDPFPAYSHNPELVVETLRHLEWVWPPESPLTVHVCAFESVTRTNGLANQWQVLDEERTPQRPWDSEIWLWAKRTPPHPSMTRFLVAHEYGHHVKAWLERHRGLDRDQVLEEYAELRLADAARAAGGTWHRSAGEVLADDFRILAAGVEGGHWPHPGVVDPREDQRVRAWWRAALDTRARFTPTAEPATSASS